MSDKLKAGYYVGFIQKWSLGKSKTKETPQFIITFALDHFKGAKGVVENVAPDLRNIYRPITANTIEYFVNDLKALGYDRDNFDDLDPESPTAFDFEGKEIEARLKYETYEGKEQERWELALVKPEAKPLEATGVASLNAMFGGHLKALAGSRPPVPAAAPGYSNPDNDIPF